MPRPIQHPVSLMIAFILGVVLAGAGTAAAGELITGRDVRDGSLTGKDLHNGSVAGRDIHDGSIAARDLSPAARPRLPRAFQAAPGVTIPVNAGGAKVVELSLPAGRWNLSFKAIVRQPGQLFCDLRYGGTPVDSLDIIADSDQLGTILLTALVGATKARPATVICSGATQVNIAAIKLIAAEVA